ncbi:MAG TPA: hypothetical protein VMH77_00945, partial [Steroidobacteraceae bacterium]|nr:hypothetical protein [Steroidobacteraceae bacterium]
QPAAAPSLCLTMVFQNTAKSRIDADRYASKHLPLLRKIYGDSVERIELRTTQASAPGMPPSPVIATGHVWIKDVRAFSQALQAGSAEINRDLDATAKGPRVSQVDLLVASAGDPLPEVKSGQQVFMTFFPVQEGKTLDKDYFKANHVAKLYSIFGAQALRRVEGTFGQDQGSAKATYVATTNLYIRDRGAYDDAMKQGMNDMIDDIKKFTTITPLFSDMRITAVG